MKSKRQEKSSFLEAWQKGKRLNPRRHCRPRLRRLCWVRWEGAVEFKQEYAVIWSILSIRPLAFMSRMAQGLRMEENNYLNKSTAEIKVWCVGSLVWWSWFHRLELHFEKTFLTEMKKRKGPELLGKFWPEEFVCGCWATDERSAGKGQVWGCGSQELCWDSPWKCWWDWSDPIDVFISTHKYSEDIWGLSCRLGIVNFSEWTQEGEKWRKQGKRKLLSASPYKSMSIGDLEKALRQGKWPEIILTNLKRWLCCGCGVSLYVVREKKSHCSVHSTSKKVWLHLVFIYLQNWKAALWQH